MIVERPVPLTRIASQSDLSRKRGEVRGANQEERRMHWTVGKVKITKVVELETVGSTRFILPLATNEEIQNCPG